MISTQDTADTLIPDRRIILERLEAVRSEERLLTKQLRVSQEAEIERQRRNAAAQLREGRVHR